MKFRQKLIHVSFRFKSVLGILYLETFIPPVPYVLKSRNIIKQFEQENKNKHTYKSYMCWKIT